MNAQWVFQLVNLLLKAWQWISGLIRSAVSAKNVMSAFTASAAAPADAAVA